MSQNSALTLTGVLLTGGESRRMGSDKASLVLGGRPLWNRQLTLLRTLGAEQVWISARAVPAWCPPEIETVLDAPPSRGPLSGLAASLERLRTTHLLVLAVDLPRMTVSHLRRLWAVAQPGCGVVPLNVDGHEPLCAVYPREAAAALTAALNGSSAALRPIVAELVSQRLAHSHPVPSSERELYNNMNTPAELDAARRRSRRRDAPANPGQGPVRLVHARHQPGAGV